MTNEQSPTTPPPPIMPTAEVTTPASTPTPAMELIDIEHFAKIKLRVAKIEAAEALPKSKKLLKLQLDLGESLGKRQILAGIAQFYSPESLIGKHIVVVANLKPASLMGHESQGMMLAASSPDGTKLAFVTPEQGMVPGSEVR